MFRALLALLALTLLAPSARAQCIPEWTPGFGATGVGGSVSAQAVFDDGTGPALYAGGLFTQAGGLSAKNIARWDGTTWAPLASGQPSTVRALAAFDPDGPGPSPASLYAGGDGPLSRWDGSSWTILPQPPDGAVRALAVFDDGSGPALYAAGDFLNAGGGPASHIARWNGQSWAALAAGISGNVYSLAVFDDGGGPALYGGGIFTKAGGSDANRIARWNGLAWSPLGPGTSGAVTALAVYNDGSGDALYAGGLFNKAGGNDASRIARWDGVSWSPLKGGVSDVVYALAVHDDGNGPALFVGGQFTLADGKNALHIARWESPAKGWSALGAGTDNNVLSLSSYDDDGGSTLITGGDFVKASGGTVNHIAQWRENAWSGLGAAVDNIIYALRSFDDGSGDAVYAGGEFLNAGGVAASNIARWNGAFWSSLDAGLNGPVFALARFNDGAGLSLYAGGFFTKSGNTSVRSIARWSGSKWEPLGTGLDNQVWAIRAFDDGSGDALYVGGDFSNAGGNPASRIAIWNGLTWSALGTGVNSRVAALAVFDDGSGDALYIAGDFTTAGGNAANRIAKWNGLAWSPVGSGVNNSVYALATFDDGSGPALYAAGSFTSAGGHPVSNIARWNGLEWSALGTGLNASAHALTVHDDGSGRALYVTGEFTQAGGVPIGRIAKWDGLAWSKLDAGINGTGYALASLPEGNGSALFVGGSFPTAGNLPSSNIARWGCPGAPADLCELPPLVAPSAQPEDFFGQSLGISGDTMIVGAFGDDSAGDNAGAAQVFSRDGARWNFAQTLIPADLIAGDFFGASAAVDGPFAIVGAPRADPAGASSGAAYIYRLDAGLWVQDAKLVPDDADPADQFGYSVDILGDTAIVGAWRADLPGGKTRAGAAYIFTRELGAWVQKTKLTADDASADDNLGASVALTGAFAIAGAPGDDNAKGADAGAAYIYFRVGDQWGDWEKLIPSDAKSGDAFGFSVAGDDIRLIVGAPGADSLGADAGLAFLFHISGGHWLIEDTLFPSGLKAGDALGSAVAIRGPLALVGGYQSDLQGVDSGAVSLFERDGSNWFETAKLTGNSIQPGDNLGASVAIGPSELAAGAIHADAPGGSDQGAVIIYSTIGCPCYPDFTGDGALDLFDFLGYVNAFNAAQPAADCTQDGVLDLFDFLCFVNTFNAGC